MISAIIPVGDFERDYENLKHIVRMCNGRDIELIIVNDSSGESKNMEKNILDLGDRNLQVVNSRKRNPGGARNVGLQYATGEHVIFWDSDDQPVIDNVLIMSKVLEAVKFDFVVGGYMKSADNSIGRYVKPHEDPIKLITCPGLWRIMFKRKSVMNLKFIECNIGEDQIFLADIFDHKLIGAKLDKSVYIYKQGTQGLTHSAKITTNYEHTLNQLVKKSGIKSKNQEIVYFNLLLSYLKRTNVFMPRNSVSFLVQTKKTFGNNFIRGMLRALYTKVGSN